MIERESGAAKEVAEATNDQTTARLLQSIESSDRGGRAVAVWLTIKRDGEGEFVACKKEEICLF